MNRKPLLLCQVKNKGQLSIFMGITLLIMMTLIAFIINVGLFVKAKINLQNAVDAAAWAGASVQARQLSNIGYLNWEMRNVYKEWMFKYYALGRLRTTQNLNASITGNRMNFRLDPFFDQASGYSNNNVFDPYNVPSICVHFGSPHDICEIYDIPGLPRFNTVGLPSVSEHHEIFLNSIVDAKAKDCTERSDLNFLTALTWAYGTGAAIFPGKPVVGADRPGAWTVAFELGLRMRNLEMIVNRPPVKEPICRSGSDCLAVAELRNETGNNFPLNERPIKAFWSAYRNLSGGTSAGVPGNEFSNSLRLTEIPPRPYTADITSLSGFLIPDGASIGEISAVPATTKSYLDLQVYPLNLLTFFTAFVSETILKGDTNSATVASEVNSEGACKSSKTALPVPGYLFGFIKNNQVMTYYAVKGEAKFIGLLFPFTETGGINLTAYSAAKPFGGKVGPRLFGIGDDGNTVTARSDNNDSKSGPYVSGILVDNPANTYTPGQPIPNVNDFYVTQPDQVIGGVPGSGIETYYAIPNLLYAYNDISDLAQSTRGAKIEIIQKAGTYAQSINPTEQKGLYDTKQYQLLIAALPTITNQNLVTSQQMSRAIEQVRRPTRYEALNYLIPTFEIDASTNPENLESVPVAQNIQANGLGGTPRYRLFAPLFGQGTLYPNLSNVTTIAESYLNSIRPSIDKFTEALRLVAEGVRNSETRGAEGTIAAANSIYPADGNLDISANDCVAPSLAAKFFHFFTSRQPLCSVVPLYEQMRTYFNDQESKATTDGRYPYSTFYQTTYYKPTPQGISNSDLKSAYSPGPRQGATINGTNPNPFSGTESSARRNYYSTKFFAIEKIALTNFPYDDPGILHEYSDMSDPTDIDSVLINTIDTADLVPITKLLH